MPRTPQSRSTGASAGSAAGVASGSAPGNTLPHDRKHRAFWFDPRFAIGLVLVAASVAGVVALVGANDSSVSILSAREPIVPGDRVTADDLVVTAARAGAAEGLYLSPDDVPADGFVVTRPIDAGEFVPASAVSSTDGIDQTSIVLALASPLPESVEPFSRVDIWSSRHNDDGVFEAPAVMVSSAVVVRLVEDDGLMARSGSTVEVLIPRDDVARVLEGVVNGAALSALPSDLPREK
jgi:hypothetical protein